MEAKTKNRHLLAQSLVTSTGIGLSLALLVVLTCGVALAIQGSSGFDWQRFFYAFQEGRVLIWGSAAAAGVVGLVQWLALLKLVDDRLPAAGEVSGSRRSSETPPQPSEEYLLTLGSGLVAADSDCKFVVRSEPLDSPVEIVAIKTR